ncbi:MAG: alpha/beta hydrolase, partial [Saprospiraceae bacterium]|nr:alpha/beta hydrolase [Saprospiraceae bacterium]
MAFERVFFKNKNGHKLTGRIDFPLGKRIEAYAIFSNVFTGNKNLNAVKYISRALTMNNIAVLRFDFQGLGESEGDFSQTNFSTNIEDIKSAASFLEENYEAPKIIVGQSLGGAAGIFAADEIDSVTAVATIGAPSKPEHVMHLLGCHIEDIEENGYAEIEIEGRPFTIRKHFLDDLRGKDLFEKVKSLDTALLIMHSPQDEVVEIEHAAEIYHAAFHPKSFVTLSKADHMLTNKDDA